MNPALGDFSGEEGPFPIISLTVPRQRPSQILWAAIWQHLRKYSEEHRKVRTRGSKWVWQWQQILCSGPLFYHSKNQRLGKVKYYCSCLCSEYPLLWQSEVSCGFISFGSQTSIMMHGCIWIKNELFSVLAGMGTTVLEESSVDASAAFLPRGDKYRLWDHEDKLPFGLSDS